MSVLTWWRKRRERALRRKVAHLRAKAAAAAARADQVQHNMDRGAVIPGHIYYQMLDDRQTAARDQILANHYAEETP